MINNNTNDVRKCEIIGGSFRVTLVVDWWFLPKILGPCWGPTKAIYRSVNTDRVIILFAGGGDTWTQFSVIKVVWTFCTERRWGAKNPIFWSCKLYVQIKRQVSNQTWPLGSSYASKKECRQEIPLRIWNLWGRALVQQKILKKQKRKKNAKPVLGHIKANNPLDLLCLDFTKVENQVKKMFSS